MKIKNKIIILILILLLSISFMGYGVWIISKDFEVKPNPIIDKVITRYLDNSIGTYDGNVLLPSSEYIGTITNKRNDDLKYYYKEVDSSSDYIECVDSNTSIGPINAGNYLIQVIYTLNEQGIKKEFTIEGIHFTISPRSIETATVSVDSCTYLGNAVTPSIKVSITLNNKTTTLVEGKDYTKEYSKNDSFGTGNVSIIGKGNYANVNNTSFTIKRAIYANNYELNYNSSIRLWSDVKANIKNNIGFKDYLDDSDVTISDNNGITITSINDGTFEFKDGGYNGNSLTTGLETISNVIGSTYIIDMEFSSDEYELMTITNNPNKKDIKKPLFKYKTVNVNGTYYTIEDAILLNNGQMTLLGDSTNATSFIYTAFCNLDSINYPYTELNSNNKHTYTISNRNLIVPYSTSTNIDKLDSPALSESISNQTVYACLYVSDNIKLIFNNSILLVDAQIGFAQPSTTISTLKGVIKNEGSIILENESKIYAFGFIKGDGLIESKAGTTIQDAFATYDWPGGNTATKLKNTLPMNAWTVHNVSCVTKIYANAFYTACFYAKPTAEVYTVVKIVGNTSDCLFKPTNDNSYIIKKSSNAKSNANGNELNIITKSNQIAGQKDLVYLYGEFEDGSIKIEKGSFSVETNTSKACPISYLNLILAENSKLTLKSASYLFLPGTSLIVNTGASLIIEENVNLSFESYAHVKKVLDDKIGNSAASFKTYCKDTEDAQLVVNGSFVSNNGYIGGKINSTQENGTLDFSNSNLTSSFYSLCNANGAAANSAVNCAYIIKNFNAIGLINNTNTYYAFLNETYRSIKADDTIVWSGSTGNVIEIDSNGDLSSGDSISGCVIEGTLITLADGTKRKVEDLTPNDILLVFNHETGTYDFAKINFIDADPYANYTIINLKFSNGSLVKVISEHGFFDLDLMQYVYIDEFNYKDYIGHRFYSATWDGKVYNDSIVTLDEAYITHEYTRCYSPVTLYHLNYFTEDMLSMPGGISGLFNIFEYDSNLKYNEEKMKLDIEKYGLFTYEDFKDKVPYEVYMAFPTKYFKVAIAKGILTEDMIDYYIKRYLPLMS